MDPGNLEFTEEPRNRSLTMERDQTVQYADVAGAPKDTQPPPPPVKEKGIGQKQRVSNPSHI